MNDSNVLSWWFKYVNNATTSVNNYEFKNEKSLGEYEPKIKRFGILLPRCYSQRDF